MPSSIAAAMLALCTILAVQATDQEKPKIDWKETDAGEFVAKAGGRPIRATRSPDAASAFATL